MLKAKHVKNKKMITIQQELHSYGICNIKHIFYNSSYNELRNHETQLSLTRHEKGYITDRGAVAIDTGKFTGRSPQDKYIVREPSSEKNIWWATDTNGSDNKPITQKVWEHLKHISLQQLSSKKIYVVDCFCGANRNARLSIRFVVEVAWQAHFIKNMFIRPSQKELHHFKPDFIVLNASKTTNNIWKKQYLNSEVFIAFHLAENMAVIGGTWYGGEMKKGIFSIMNYYLPLKDIASMHASANQGKNGDTALFFGLSGTGKTTLSTDPSRALIGDDEHGWDENGIFNFEGGCYAKVINLSKKNEPDIYHAIKRNALLENVVFNSSTGKVDFNDYSKTENTRVSYPLYHIENSIKPISCGTHPKKIIFLTADAFGVLPPVAKLSREQTQYHFLSGFTSKLSGTERGVTTPTPTFSACFGAPFLLLHPIVYAQELIKKIEKYNTEAFLVNTGWIGGPFGIGKRIDIPTTRKIITAILDNSIHKSTYDLLPVFHLSIPTFLQGIERDVLNPCNIWPRKDEWEEAANDLALKFINNFEKFSDTSVGKKLVHAGPQVSKLPVSELI